MTVVKQLNTSFFLLQRPWQDVATGLAPPRAIVRVLGNWVIIALSKRTILIFVARSAATIIWQFGVRVII